jgi:hypothetical protein
MIETAQAAVLETVELGRSQPAGVAQTNTVGTILSNVLLIMFVVGGLSVLVFFIWGAMDWVLAGGDKEKIGAARKKITNSLIGLALLALSYFIITVAGEVVGFNPLKLMNIPTLGTTVSLQQPATQTQPAAQQNQGPSTTQSVNELRRDERGGTGTGN